MRVVLIVTGFPDANNLARSVFNFRAAFFLGRVHTVEVVKLKMWRPFSPVFRKFIISGVDVNEVSTFAYSFLSFSPRFLKLILKLSFLFPSIKRIKGDIIHAVGGGLAAQFAASISERKGIPYIIQYIGSDLNFYLRKNFSDNSIRKVVSNASFHCFNSKALQQLFDELFIDHKFSTRVIYRGVDTNEFRFHEKVSTGIRFLFLGGFVSDDSGTFPFNLKGGITLLKAWKAFTGSHIVSSASLTIAGPGTSTFSYENYLSKEDQRGLRILGPMTRSEVVREMSLAHCVIIPSLFEGLPNVAFEAMAAGNVIIASSVGGIPEIIEHGVNGILVPPNDVNALADSIKYICNHPGFAKQASVKNVAKAATLNVDCFVSSYSSVYNVVLGNS